MVTDLLKAEKLSLVGPELFRSLQLPENKIENHSDR